MDQVINEVEVEVRKDWKGEFEEWLSTSGRRGGRSEATVRSYLFDLAQFERWFEIENGQALEPELVTSWDLRAWRKYAMDVERVSPATWNRRFAMIRTFCEWGKLQGYLSYDATQGVMWADEEETPPRWLTEVEINRVMRVLERAITGAATTRQWWLAIRDQAMVAMMAFGGLRVEEVCALEMGDVTVGDRRGKVIVRKGKGEKQREVPLGSEILRTLRQWLEVRGEVKSERAVLFVGKSNERLQRRGIEKRLAVIGEKAKVGHLTPHDLRHTCAKRMVDRGVPLTVVQAIMGHRNIQTTAKYTKPGWEDLEKAME